MIGLDQLDVQLQETIRPLLNLKMILKWIPSVGLDLKLFDLVQQDEYNYDAFFPWFDHRWISFGVS